MTARWLNKVIGDLRGSEGLAMLSKLYSEKDQNG